MKPKIKSIKSSYRRTASGLVTELLILPDGRILVHNLTQSFAELLRELNPGDEQISSRVAHYPSTTHELPD